MHAKKHLQGGRMKFSCSKNKKLTDSITNYTDFFIFSLCPLCPLWQYSYGLKRAK